MWLSWWLACHGAPSGPVVDRVVEAGCGTCVFHMPEMKGCFWAIQLDGQAYPVSGVHPPDDMLTAHEAGGMCTTARQAHVVGEIRPDGRFLAQEFELLPLTGPAPPSTGHAH